jgi:hypothetical protein
MKNKRIEKFNRFLNENWKDNLENSLSSRKDNLPIYAQEAADIIAESDMYKEFKLIAIKSISDYMKKFDPNFKISYEIK